MIHELRQVLRSLIKAKGLMTVVIGTLSLGIGANTAIFSVANTLLLRPLPYHDSQRLVLIWGNFLKLKIEHLPAKSAEYLDYRDQKDILTDVAAFQNHDFTLTGVSTAEQLVGARVSGNLFSLIGAQAGLGRSILPEDCLAGRNRVAVISNALWQRRFGGNPTIIASTIELDNERYQVVGVMPPAFTFPHRAFSFAEPADLWTPLTLDPKQVEERTGGYSHIVIGRLRDGVGLEQARSAMSGLASRMEEQYRGYRGPKGEDGGWRVTLVTLQEEVSRGSRYSVLILFGISGFVLLIACANVANLLLLRSTARRREFALRIALGATRGRIIKQQLIESTLLGLAGGAVGILIAVWSLDLLLAISPGQLPRSDEISLDWRVLTFAILVSTITGFVCGIAPALRESDQTLIRAMREAPSDSGGRSDKLRKLLVTVQIGVAVCVASCAALLVQSFVRLQAVDPGLNPHGLLSFELSLPEAKYSDGASVAAFTEAALIRIKALPGVEGAALGAVFPLSGTAIDDPFSIEGSPLDISRLTIAGHQSVSPGFFATMRIPLLRGRDFNETDSSAGPEVAIINRQMAERFFADDDPIGRRIKLGAPQGPAKWSTIVGVVGNIPHRRLGSQAEPDWYIPQSQTPSRKLSVFVRSQNNPSSLTATISAAISAIDPGQPIVNVRTMEDAIAETLAPRRFNTVLAALFAMVALLLAGGGIYSLIAYAMYRRTREIGIRIALGARRRDIVKLGLVEGAFPAVIGITVGLGLALALSSLLRSMLFGVTVSDPLTFASIAMLTTVVAILGCYLPTRRARRIDPVVALRYE